MLRDSLKPESNLSDDPQSPLTPNNQAGQIVSETPFRQVSNISSKAKTSLLDGLVSGNNIKTSKREEKTVQQNYIVR